MRTILTAALATLSTLLAGCQGGATPLGAGHVFVVDRGDGRAEIWTAYAEGEDLVLCAADACVDFGGGLESQDAELVDRASAVAFDLFLECDAFGAPNRSDATAVHGALTSRAGRAVIAGFVHAFERASGTRVERSVARGSLAVVNDLQVVVEWLRRRSQAAWTELAASIRANDAGGASFGGGGLDRIYAAVRRGNHERAGDLANALGATRNAGRPEHWNLEVRSATGRYEGTLVLSTDTLERAIQIGRLQNLVGSARSKLAHVLTSEEEAAALRAIEELTSALRALIEHELRPLWRAFL